MAPPRTIGKGRVLGAAKTSLPVGSPSASSVNSGTISLAPERPKPTNGLWRSPSPSAASVDSHSSTQKSSFEDHAISSAVALEARENAASQTRMACPICDEEMMTLLQLNRHLDDDHKNLEVVQQDEVKTWFKTQMVKAKKFQPLAVLNQKLKGLDIFESNEDGPPVTANPAFTRSGQNSAVSPLPPASIDQAPVDPDTLVTKEHWQRYTQTGLCSDPMCGKRLGGSNGNINCRKCGKLFCEEHTMYQMKLSRSAQHEPVRGHWLRVCETCYISRSGYNDHNGFERDHMSVFAKMRRTAVDKNYLEISRLEKRLTKLTQILADPMLQQQDQTMMGYLKSLSGGQTQQRLAEQSIVEWEDDVKVDVCPFCRQDFSNYSFRRHHCRLCGRVVCADPATSCSNEVGLHVAAGHSQRSDEKTDAANVTNVDVRICKECQHKVFSKYDFQKEVTGMRPDQKAFQNLKQFESGIQRMLPRFQKLLVTLQDPDYPPTPSQLAEASKVRKRLTDAFTQYTIAAQRIRDLPAHSAAQQKLQKQIYSRASQFLHIHMLTLKSVPKMLKSSNALGNLNGTPPHSRSSSSSSITPMNGFHSPQPNGRPHVPSTLQTSMSPEPDVEPAAAQTNEKDEEESKKQELRDQIVVLEEQKFMIGEMLADSQRRRKFDDVESLGRNLDDIEAELRRARFALDKG